MLTYSNLNPNKKAFIFELDNVLYPEKDYLLQVYYLFANFIEYSEGHPFAVHIINFCKEVYQCEGDSKVFDRVKKEFNIDEKYRENFIRLHQTAKLPLKLLLYQNILLLLQEIVIDRKQIYVITNGDPQQQLNKIKQIEWHGLEQYLTVYFANEIKPKPDINVLQHVTQQHNLIREDIVIIGNSVTDKEFAMLGGIDYIEISEFL